MVTSALESKPLSGTAAPDLFDCRDAYSEDAGSIGRSGHERSGAVVADSVSSTKLKNFQATFPNRFVNVGIAEQNMVGVGAGLANGGMKTPYVSRRILFPDGHARWSRSRLILGTRNGT